MLNIATLHCVPFMSVNDTTSGEVHELLGCRLMMQMPSPDEPLFFLMPRASLFLKPVTNSAAVYASMSSEQMLNMATSQSVTFAPMIAIIQLPVIGLMIHMPSPDEPLFCWAPPLPRRAMAWGLGLQQSGAVACVLRPKHTITYIHI